MNYTEMIILDLKTCKICKESLPKTREFFHVNNQRKDGFNSICKECHTNKDNNEFNIINWYDNKSVRFKNTWKLNDILWIYNNYLELEKRDILAYFNYNLNYKTITNIVYQWNLRKVNKNKDWSVRDIELLKENYPYKPQSELEKMFANRTWDAIKIKASKLNIQRNDDILYKIRSESHIGIKPNLSEEQRKKMSLARKGKNNHGWKGGISPIVTRLREYTIPWKIDSLRAFDYKCALSRINDGTLEIHHYHKNFSEIVYEVFSNLGLKMNSDMSKYSQSERNEIQFELLRLHYFYGLGVPLTKEIHKLFHSEYGNRNNDKKQFDEFKYNYFNGHYNSKLNINKGGESHAKREKTLY